MLKEEIPIETNFQSSNRIRVGFLIDNLNVAGTEQWLLRLITSLDSRRFEPHLFLLNGTTSLSKELEPSNIPVHRLELTSFKNPARLQIARRKFTNALHEHGIQIVQVHFPDSTIFGAVAARLAGIKNIIATSRNAGYSLSRSKRLVGRIAHRFISNTIANSVACKSAVVDAFHVNPDSVSVIPNGIDLRRFSAIPTVDAFSHSGHPKWRIGIVANLRPVKDVSTLIQAAKILKDCSANNIEFFVAGDGPLRQELISESLKYSVAEDIHFLGTVDNIPKFLASIDIAVLTSISEGCSNSVLEYMAAGRPVVATAVGGTREVVRHEKTGITIKPQKPNELADAIMHLVNSPSTLNELASAGRDYVESNHSQELETASYSNFYTQLLCQTD